MVSFVVPIPEFYEDALPAPRIYGLEFRWPPGLLPTSAGPPTTQPPRQVHHWTRSLGPAGHSGRSGARPVLTSATALRDRSRWFLRAQRGNEAARGLGGGAATVGRGDGDKVVDPGAPTVAGEPV